MFGTTVAGGQAHDVVCIDWPATRRQEAWLSLFAVRLSSCLITVLLCQELIRKTLGSRSSYSFGMVVQSEGGSKDRFNVFGDLCLRCHHKWCSMAWDRYALKGRVGMKLLQVGWLATSSILYLLSSCAAPGARSNPDHPNNNLLRHTWLQSFAMNDTFPMFATKYVAGCVDPWKEPGSHAPWVPSPSPTIGGPSIWPH